MQQELFYGISIENETRKISDYQVTMNIHTHTYKQTTFQTLIKGVRK